MKDKNKEDKRIIINIINKVKKTKKTDIILMILILIFISILILIQNGKTVEFDKYITEFITTTIPNNLTNILEVITNIGGLKILPIIVLVTFFILVCLKKRNYARLIGLNVILSTIVYLIIKELVKRPRPEPFRFIVEIGYSFPSGHATNNMAFYGVLIFLIYTKIKNKKIKILLTTLCILGILTIGISRVYFNVHYPSDIIEGYILGIIISIISIKIFKKIENRQKYLKDFKK